MKNTSVWTQSWMGRHIARVNNGHTRSELCLILRKTDGANLLSLSLSFLLAFLWNCGRLVTSSQPRIESFPSIVTEGQHVILHVYNIPENLQGFIWFKGMTVHRHLEIGRYTIGRKSSVFGPAYSGREKLDSNGSLRIENVTQKDAGLYTLRVLGTDMKSEEAHVELQVNSK